MKSRALAPVFDSSSVAPFAAVGGTSYAASLALVLASELGAQSLEGVDAALARYAERRRPRTAHVQHTTAVRNQLAALPLESRTQAIAHWEQISIGSFAPLVAEP